MEDLRAPINAGYMLNTSQIRDGIQEFGNDPSPTGAQEYGDPFPEGGPPENSINLISIANNLGSIDIIASMKTFVEILDAVVVVHAFVAVVAIPLKAIARMELRRKLNDRHIPVLFHGMMKMTSRLTQLIGVKLTEAPSSLTDVLHRMEIAIETCRTGILDYLQQKKLVRFLASSFWQEKFDGFSSTFSALRGQLNDALLVVIHQNTAETRQLMDKMDKKLDKIVKSSNGPTELEHRVSSYVNANGGVERCVKQDDSLRDLILLSEDPHVDVDSGSHIQEYKKAVCSAIGLHTHEIKEGINHHAHRTMEKLETGYHERIIDPHFRRIWADAKWGDTTPGMTFVSTLYEHIRRHIHSPDSPEFALDSWTLKFLQPSYSGALLEAINTGHTGFVTVDEVNMFTRSRPLEFTLPAWLAYSASRSGFESLHYKLRILADVKQLRNLTSSSRIVNHVPNTAADYHRTVTSLICQPLLSGINVPQHLARDVESHVWLTSKLRSFMAAREATLVERLSTLHWRVDGEAEIAAVLGDVPFPQHLLPFLYLLIKHYVDLTGKMNPSLDERRYLENGCETMYRVSNAIDFRYNTWFDQNQMHTFAYGIFSNWKMSPTHEDKELRQRFAAVDTDSSGEISARELRNALRNADDSPLDFDTCKMLMGIFDTDHSGTINYPEFVQLWKYIRDWKKIFETFDRNGSGTIDLGELSHALRQFGYNLSPPLFKLIHSKFERFGDEGSRWDSPGINFDRLDEDKDGRITINYDILMLTVLAAP